MRSAIWAARSDLMDANAQVMYHSQEKGYNNILILEDDFLFDDRYDTIEKWNNAGGIGIRVAGCANKEQA